MSNQEQKYQYRYPGVTPFSTEQSHIFYGREQEIQKLLKLVHRQPLAVLYGKSGLGKSSLINAGLIPKLKASGEYIPRVIRFGAWVSTSKTTPLEFVKEQLKEPDHHKTFLSQLIPDDDSVWMYAKAQQLRGGGRPLLIFDQFEELFSYSEDEIIRFKQELSELLNTGIPLRFRRRLANFDELTEVEEELLEAPINAKVLLVIRSDRLHLLDRLRDYLPSILRHAYELKALSRADAEEAIRLPAKQEGSFVSPRFTYSAEAIVRLLDFLQDVDSGRIEGILIQMLCEYYEQKLVKLGNIRELGIAQLGDPAEVVRNYYQEKISALETEDQQAARYLIEDGLISDGKAMRLSLHETFIEQKFQVGKELLEELVGMRLLRSEPFLRGGYTYELSHDRLVAAVESARNQRRKAQAEADRLEEALALKAQAEKERVEKEKTKRQLNVVRALLSFAGLALLLAVIGLIYAMQQQARAKESEEEARRLLTENIKKDSLNRLANYRRFQAEAQRLEGQDSFFEAIENWELAKLFASDTLAIEQAIAKCRSLAGNLEQFDRWVEEARDAWKRKKYELAIQKYEDAATLRIKPELLQRDLNPLIAILSENIQKEEENAEVYRRIDTGEAAKYKQKSTRYKKQLKKIQQILASI